MCNIGVTRFLSVTLVGVVATSCRTFNRKLRFIEQIDDNFSGIGGGVVFAE